MVNIKIGLKSYIAVFILGIVFIIAIGHIFFDGYWFVPYLFAYGAALVGIAFCIMGIVSVIQAKHDKGLQVYEFNIPVPFYEGYQARKKRNALKQQLLDLRKDIQTMGFNDPIKLASFLEKEKALENLLYDPPQEEKEDNRGKYR